MNDPPPRSGLHYRPVVLLVAALMAASVVSGLVLRPVPSGHAAARRSSAPMPSASSASHSPSTTALTAADLVASLGPGQRAVAYALGPRADIYSAPEGAVLGRLSNPNSLRAPLVFLVLQAQGDWLQVMLPERPNGATGWVQASAVKLYSDDFSVAVLLALHRLDLYKDGRVLDSYQVAVGDSASPTPTGNFYVTELVAASDPQGAYGPYAFGLSAFSNTYTEFNGGPGQVAIHGTDEPWLIGTAASHGCIRLNNTQLVQLVGLLPVGTPVQILP